MIFSIVIFAKNAEKKIRKALESSLFADEIIVIDMGSTDETRKIAKNYTEHIYELPPSDYVEPRRNAGVAHASGDWVFVLDADEEIPLSLASQIRELMAGEADVYEIPRKNIMFTKFVEHSGWWPDYQRRLFRRGHLIWSDKIHSIPEATGKVVRLEAKEENALVHYNIDNLAEYFQRIDNYTAIEAEQQKKLTPPDRVINNFFADVYRRYFKEYGYKDHELGLYLSFLQGFYELVRHLKQWEMAGYPNQRPTLTWVKQVRADLAYWYADVKLRSPLPIWEQLYWQARRKWKI